MLKNSENISLKTDNIYFEINNQSILSDISLNFSPRQLYGILGPNGSGKSTLLKLLNGVLTPSKGSIFLNHQSLEKIERPLISQTISFVPQNPSPSFHFTTEKLVSMGLYANKHSSINVKEALQMVDGWHLRNKSIMHLSGGERQRVYIARALVSDAPIILLDEPTSSLDSCQQLHIWQLLSQLKAAQKLIIVTLHDLHAAERFCDTLILLNEGRLMNFGNFEKVSADFSQIFGVTECLSTFTRSYKLRNYPTSIAADVGYKIMLDC